MDLAVEISSAKKLSITGGTVLVHFMEMNNHCRSNVGLFLILLLKIFYCDFSISFR